MSYNAGKLANTNREIRVYTDYSFNKDNPKQDAIKKQNFMKIKIGKSPKEIEKIVDKLSSLKLSNEKLKKLIEQESNHLESKNEEIKQLNEKTGELETKNEEFILSIESELKQRDELESEQKSIAEYCNDLKKKFSNYDKTIEDYEQTVKNLHKERDNLQNVYDNKIGQIEFEIKKKKMRVEDRMKIIAVQRERINELESKVDLVLKETEDQKNNFAEREMVNKIRMDELENKYAFLQKRITEFQLNDDIRKAEMKGSSKRLNESKDEFKTIENNINRFEQENSELMNSIKEMSVQLNDFQCKTSTNLDFNKTSKTKSARSSKFK